MPKSEVAKAAGSASSPTIRQVDTVAITTVEPDVQEAEGQAQVLYDYEGSVRRALHHRPL